MEKFRQNLVMMTLALLSLSLFTLSSCSDDDPSYDAPTISITNLGVDADGNTKILIAVTAPAGLKSVELNDASIKDYSNEETSDIFSYTYEGSESSLTFTVVDVKDKSTDNTASIVPVEVVEGNIAASEHWTKDKRYLLTGNVFVTNNATLTIDPGTVIFGDKLLKGALIIERGSKLIAEGTAAEPIVFTSSAPAGFRNYGDWGGVILLGKAQNNLGTAVPIEGITSGDLGKHGGDNDADNSGSLKYVRIEFAGIALTTNNEINGLTFGSVGSGTVIDHIQVSYSGDDAYEWFGGTVNATNLIAYRTWDDDFDTDNGYRGKVQFGAAFRDPGAADQSGSNLFESDNNADGTLTTPTTAPIFSNITAFGPLVYAALSNTGTLTNTGLSANYQNGGHIRRNTKIRIYNSVIVGAGTSGNAPFRFTDSKTSGNEAAEVKGNYIARFLSSTTTVATIPATGYATPAANGNPPSGFNTDNFATDNTVEAGATVNISDKFPGLATVGVITNPLATVASSATFGEAKKIDVHAIDAFFTTTGYIGAVGANAGWLGETWTNYAPQSQSY